MLPTILFRHNKEEVQCYTDSSRWANLHNVAPTVRCDILHASCLGIVCTEDPIGIHRNQCSPLSTDQSIPTPRRV